MTNYSDGTIYSVYRLVSCTGLKSRPRPGPQILFEAEARPGPAAVVKTRPGPGPQIEL